MPALDVSVVIVSWNTRELLAACLRSVAEAGREIAHETIVVDNGSVDGSADLVAREFPGVRLVRNGENRGYAAAANQGIREGSGRFVLLLNPDATLPPDALRTLAAYADREPRVGLVGAALRDPDGRVQKSVAEVPSLATELLNRDLLRLLAPGRFPDLRDGTEPADVPSVVGACLLARREAIEKVGPLDEGYFVFLEETDWCVRMREAGWRVVHHPGVKVVHAQGRAKEQDPVAGWIEYYRSLYRFFRRNRSRASYGALRLLRPVKTAVNLVLVSLVLLGTLGTAARARRKARIYAGLLVWHLRGCPDGAGLRAAAVTRTEG